MPLLLILFGLLAPRVVLLIAAVTGIFTGVWQSLMWPILGFFFLPYTTLAYGLAYAYGGGIQGIWLAVLILGVLLDLGTTGESARTGRRWRKQA